MTTHVAPLKDIQQSAVSTALLLCLKKTQVLAKQKRAVPQRVLRAITMTCHGSICRLVGRKSLWQSHCKKERRRGKSQTTKAQKRSDPKTRTFTNVYEYIQDCIFLIYDEKKSAHRKQKLIASRSGRKAKIFFSSERPQTATAHVAEQLGQIDRFEQSRPQKHDSCKGIVKTFRSMCIKADFSFLV